MKKKWSEDSASSALFRNCDITKSELGSYLVRRGTAGNGMLGAIDYLRGERNWTITIVNDTIFDEARGGKHDVRE